MGNEVHKDEININSSHNGPFVPIQQSFIGPPRPDAEMNLEHFRRLPSHEDKVSFNDFIPLHLVLNISCSYLSINIYR
jgi:hypothetical protein